MLTTKRVLLGLLVLGIVGMHGLVFVGGTTAAHHSWPTTSVAGIGHDHATASSAPSVMPDVPESHAGDEGDEGEATVLALCMVLLLALVLVAAGPRRTTWVALLDRLVPRVSMPVAPVLRDRTPVPRFTVMLC